MSLSYLTDCDKMTHPNTIIVNPRVRAEIDEKVKQLTLITKKKLPELWMYFDSGAPTGFVISTDSSIKPHPKKIRLADGSCSIGNGEPLQYLHRGSINDRLELTVVKDLKFDLYSVVSAAKQGISSIIDFDQKTGTNKSH
jgi:hypothetical protein